MSWLSWTPAETARMAALAETTSLAFPLREVCQYLVTCDPFGVLLPRAKWRWRISMEWEIDRTLHERSYEAATLDQMERRLGFWLEAERSRADPPSYPAWAEAVASSPPWVVCRRGSVAEVVLEARRCEQSAENAAGAGHVESARAWAQWSKCCWVWALMALLEGRRMA